MGIDFINHFIEQYGYWALFFGAMIEGESIVFTISSLCYFGKFNFLYVNLITFFGTLAADQITFYLGLMIGSKIFRKFPKLEKKTEHAFNLLKKNETFFIIAFRFIYGIRILSPIIIGMAKVSKKKFTILNLIAAFVWTTTSCGIGYFVGYLSSKIGSGYNTYIVIAANLILIFSIHYIAKKFTKKI